MKRFHLMLAALLALFAVSAVAVSAASAVEFLLALWLEGGSPVTSILLVESEGELELTGLNAGNLKIKVKVLCSGILDGWVGPESLDFISELLVLGGTRAIPTATLTGEALLCTNIENCTEPEVWADVPFESEVELMVDGAETFFVDLLFKAGYYVQCLVAGVTIAELCEQTEANPGIVKLTNEANGTVDGEFLDSFQTLGGGVLGTCTLGGAESSEVSGLGITLETGVSLSVSSE